MFRSLLFQKAARLSAVNARFQVLLKERGMAEMSAKFRALGGEVYIEPGE
jgi:hypothetical protein